MRRLDITCIKTSKRSLLPRDSTYVQSSELSSAKEGRTNELPNLRWKAKVQELREKVAQGHGQESSGWCEDTGQRPEQNHCLRLYLCVY